MIGATARTGDAGISPPAKLLRADAEVTGRAMGFVQELQIQIAVNTIAGAVTVPGTLQAPVHPG